jgi:hypothetical protein
MASQHTEALKKKNPHEKISVIQRPSILSLMDVILIASLIWKQERRISDYKETFVT